ncbi:hypothetical protein ES332_D08G226700v1, partial [Gossypium tomentosum]
IGSISLWVAGTSIQLVQTCLVLSWDQDNKSSFAEEVCTSFVEVRTNGLIRDFLRIDLVTSHIFYIRKRNDTSGLELISDNRSDRTNKNPQNHGTIHTLLNRNKESQSLIILSSSNCFRMGPFNYVKYHNTSVAKYLELDNLKQAFQVLNYYLIAENGKIYKFDPCRNIFLNAVNLNWYFSHHHYHHNYCEEISTIISFGQFICENVCIAKNGPRLKSGQVFIAQVDSIILRSAKPYLATPGATVHGYCGEILYEGDTLVTFIYEKSRSGDVLQLQSLTPQQK